MLEMNMYKISINNDLYLQTIRKLSAFVLKYAGDNFNVSIKKLSFSIFKCNPLKNSLSVFNSFVAFLF
jgi:hypothetical protein